MKWEAKVDLLVEIIDVLVKQSEEQIILLINQEMRKIIEPIRITEV